MKRIYVQNGIVFFMGIRLAIWETGKQSLTACSKKRSWFHL